MKQIQFKKLIILPFAILLFSACDSSKVKTLGDGGGASTEEKVDDAKFFIKAKKSSTSENPKDEYIIHTLEGGISGDTSWANACEISSSQLKNSNQDIMCLVEVPELDLHVAGLNFNYNIPANVCEHFTVEGYYYFNWLAGRVSPTAVSGTCGSAPSCAYDHTLLGGPDCCEGYWDDTAACTAAGETGDIHEYPGKMSNCLAGAGFDSAIGKDQYGFPKYTIYDGSNGVNKSIDFTPPMNKESGTSVYIANYYNPADHTITTTNKYATELGTTAPISFQQPANTTNINVQPFYTFTCYDRAKEVKARIRIMVREWNKKTVSQGESPDDTGFEDDFSGDINDYEDWKDLVNLFPEENLK